MTHTLIRQGIIAIITLSIFGYVSYIGIKNIFRYNVLSREQVSVFNQVIIAQRQCELLKREIVLSAEKGYWEYLSKKELGYIYSNEAVYYIRSNRQ